MTALYDPDREKLDRAADAFGVDGRFSSHQELLASGEVDGVIIAVPHVHHYGLARDALDAGVHVLVEKPMTLRAADAWDLVERARTAKLHLMCGYTFQFTSHAAHAYEVVRSGRIGELRLVTATFASMVRSYLAGHPEDYRPVFEFPLTGPDAQTYSDPTVAGGGQGWTQVTHPMGMVFWVTGGRPSVVSAFMENAGLAVDLVNAISYRFSDGAVGTIAATGEIHPGQDQEQKITYFGSLGYLVQDLIGGRLVVHYADGSTDDLGDLDADEVYPTSAPARSLVDLILGDGENKAPGEPAARAVEFLEAAYHSAALGRPVHVKELEQQAAVSER